MFRCFEINEFSGVNFVKSPCRYLRTVEKIIHPEAEEEDTPGLLEIRKVLATEKKSVILTKFQTAVRNCCDEATSETTYRYKVTSDHPY